MSESQLKSLLLLCSDYIHFVIVAKKNPYETCLKKKKKAAQRNTFKNLY